MNYTAANMPLERIAFLRAINANPRDRTLQLVYADWLKEAGESRWEAFWRVGRGGLGGLVGLVGLVGLYQPENPIVLIPGETVMVFIPAQYGFSVLVGQVQTETPAGWIVDPCREILDTRNGDCWVELAAGTNKKLRSDCQYGPPIKGGSRVPMGCLSILWWGELPG